MIYGAVIRMLFGAKYEKLIDEVRTKRSNIFQMTDESICGANFNEEWNEVGTMFRKHDLDIKSLDDLRTCDLSSVEELKGILQFLSFF